MAGTAAIAPVAVRPSCLARVGTSGLSTGSVPPEEQPQWAVLARHRDQRIHSAERAAPAGSIHPPLTLASARRAAVQQGAVLTPEAHSHELLVVVLPQQRHQPLPRDLAAPADVPAAEPGSVAAALVGQGRAAALAREELAEDAAALRAEARPALLRRRREHACRPGPPGRAEPELVHLAGAVRGAAALAQGLAGLHLLHDAPPDARVVLLDEAGRVAAAHEALAREAGVEGA
mmetsp:Transcript_14169/g.29716  ORF Transcript_14169/g.29716 Transcript_14169/m.29716 type:complete len:233 (+) Transcript_14169:344-1042(+)